MITFTLKLEGIKERFDIVDALNYAIEKIEDGYNSGDLRNESIEFGSYEIGGKEESEMSGASPDENNGER